MDGVYSNEFKDCYGEYSSAYEDQGDNTKYPFQSVDGSYSYTGERFVFFRFGEDIHID